MGNSHKISAALSIMFPASLLLAGSIFTSYADTRRASAHPAPSAAPADTMESRQAALPARSAISLLAADVDTTDLEEVELPFRTIVEEVPDVDPVAWADTALFHFHNTATDSRYLRLTDDDYRTVAEELGVETAAIKAVVDIEAGPSHKGFWKPGKPLINFDLSMFQQFARRRGVSLEKARKSSPVISANPTGPNMAPIRVHSMRVWRPPRKSASPLAWRVVSGGCFRSEGSTGVNAGATI